MANVKQFVYLVGADGLLLLCGMRIMIGKSFEVSMLVGTLILCTMAAAEMLEK